MSVHGRRISRHSNSGSLPTIKDEAGSAARAGWRTSRLLARRFLVVWLAWLLLCGLFALRHSRLAREAAGSEHVLPGRGRQAQHGQQAQAQLHSESPEAVLAAQREAWPDGYVAVCAVVKDQWPDLRYWIEYHRWLGVSKFYIYDNNSTLPGMLVLWDYLRSGLVEYQYFLGRPRRRPDFTDTNQYRAYQSCLLQHFKQHRWLAFIDADEFFVFPKDQQQAQAALERRARLAQAQRQHSAAAGAADEAAGAGAAARAAAGSAGQQPAVDSSGGGGGGALPAANPMNPLGYELREPGLLPDGQGSSGSSSSLEQQHHAAGGGLVNLQGRVVTQDAVAAHAARARQQQPRGQAAEQEQLAGNAAAAVRRRGLLQGDPASGSTAGAAAADGIAGATAAGEQAAAGSGGEGSSDAGAGGSSASSHNHLALFLSGYEQHAALGINWVLFGSSGHVSRPPGGPLASYTSCVPPTHWESTHVKVIANTNGILGMGGTPHEVKPRPGRTTVDVDGQPFRGPKTPQAKWHKLVLHHYVLKSAAEFAAKHARGSGAGNVKGWSYWAYVQGLANETCTDALPVSAAFLAAAPALRLPAAARLADAGCHARAAAAAAALRGGGAAAIAAAAADGVRMEEASAGAPWALVEPVDGLGDSDALPC